MYILFMDPFHFPRKVCGVHTFHKHWPYISLWMCFLSLLDYPKRCLLKPTEFLKVCATVQHFYFPLVLLLKGTLSSLILKLFFFFLIFLYTSMYQLFNFLNSGLFSWNLAGVWLRNMKLHSINCDFYRDLLWKGIYLHSEYLYKICLQAEWNRLPKITTKLCMFN